MEGERARQEHNKLLWFEGLLFTVKCKLNSEEILPVVVGTHLNGILFK